MTSKRHDHHAPKHQDKKPEAAPETKTETKTETKPEVKEVKQEVKQENTTDQHIPHANYHASNDSKAATTGGNTTNHEPVNSPLSDDERNQKIKVLATRDGLKYFPAGQAVLNEHETRDSIAPEIRGKNFQLLDNVDEFIRRAKALPEDEAICIYVNRHDMERVNDEIRNK